MSDKIYVVETQDGYSFAGTLTAITDWLYDMNVGLASCEFYEVGKKVQISIEVIGVE